MLSRFSKLSSLIVIIFLEFNVCFSIVIHNLDLIGLNKYPGKVPWASSTYHLAFLAKLEPELVQLILEHKKSLANKDYFIEQLERFGNSEDHELYNSEAFTVDDLVDDNSDAMTTALNPIKAYKMIWRFVHLIIPIIQNELSLNDDVFPVKVLPDYQDLKDIQENILRLSEFYRLNVTLMSSGSDLFGNEILPLELTYDLANRALKTHMYSEALKWLTASYEKSLDEESSSIETEEILESVKDLISEHDELYDYILKNKVGNTNPYLFITPIKNAEQLVTVKEYLESQVSANFSRLPSTKTEFELLCRGQHPQSITLSNLTCWYEYSHFPAYAMKIEMHSPEINLVEIHEFLGPRLSEHIIKASANIMTRATLFDKESYKSTSHISNKLSRESDRVSAVTFLDDANDSLMQKMSARIEQVTGLKVCNKNLGNDSTKEAAYASEPIQVVSYAFGGHYAPHFDVMGLERSRTDFGDRLATFMIYLSNVEAGGFTVFPELRLSIIPKAGSAIFWYNMKKNGELDNLTFHGACPVALGRKIVANKWILEHENCFTRKCSTANDD